jgi:endonuclease-3
MANMTPQQRAEPIWAYFQVHNPVPETELRYENPFQLLVAVILSAQCTDVRINQVTPALFEQYPTAERMAEATFEELFPFIRTVSYPNNKTKNLLGMARQLVDEFNGIVPSSVEQLVKLPGVGRKTANVIASVLYDKPAMAVDTHVFRVSNRLGLTEANNPVQSERQLMTIIPTELVAKAHHWLILHGRYVCKARKPSCEQCGIQQWCRYFEDHQQVARVSEPGSGQV